jgi:hypothetical protein
LQGTPKSKGEKEKPFSSQLPSFWKFMWPLRIIEIIAKLEESLKWLRFYKIIYLKNSGSCYNSRQIPCNGVEKN